MTRVNVFQSEATYESRKFLLILLHYSCFVFVLKNLNRTLKKAMVLEVGEKKSGSWTCLLSVNSITIEGKTGYKLRQGCALEAELPVILVLPVLNHWVNKDFSLGFEVKLILKLTSEGIECIATICHVRKFKFCVLLQKMSQMFNLNSIFLSFFNFLIY